MYGIYVYRIKAYEDATTELKQEDKGFTKNYAAISRESKNKLNYFA